MASLIKNKAGWTGMRSALVGSLLFAIPEGIRLGYSQGGAIAGVLLTCLAWIAVIFYLGGVLTVPLGYFGGRIIERLYQNRHWSRGALMALGAGMGAATVTLISLPDLMLVLLFNGYLSIQNNAAFPIYLTRLAEVVAIAGLMGVWAGYSIARPAEPSQPEAGSM